jgi:hypothetical protein
MNLNSINITCDQIDCIYNDHDGVIIGVSGIVYNTCKHAHPAIQRYGLYPDWVGLFCNSKERDMTDPNKKLKIQADIYLGRQKEINQKKEMKYLYRKGRIVTITWKHGGWICKVLARPGQLVYDPITNESHLLDEGKYVVYYEELRIEHADYMATLHHGMYLLLPGILVDEIHLNESSNYEKYLRRKGTHKSPFYNSEEPLGEVGEILAFKYLGKLRLVQILKVVNTTPPCFELTNGDCIERGSLKIFYRRTNEYEKTIFQKKKANQNRPVILAIS